MTMVGSSLVRDIWGDISHCKDLFWVLLSSSQQARIAIYTTLVVLIFFTLWQSYSSKGALIYILKVAFSVSASFFIFASTERFLLVAKNTAQFRFMSGNRKYIKKCVDKLQNENRKNPDSPEGALCLLSVSYFKTTESVLWRLAMEVVILSYILLLYAPLLLLMNIIIVTITTAYFIMYRIDKESCYFDFMEVVESIMYMHKINPIQCRKFVLDNSVKEVRQLSTIYSVVSHKV